MKFEVADCADIGFVHLMTLENLKDQGLDWKYLKDNPDVWIKKFSDPRFVCLVGKHGRKPVGIVTGVVEESIGALTLVVDAFFLRRQWRGKIKPVRRMVVALNDFLTHNGIKRIEMEATEKNTTCLMKKGFKTSRIVMEREAK
jgi:hypothetical protein